MSNRYEPCSSSRVTLRRPRRLRSFSYRGKYSYFVTFCTHDRRDAFTSPERVECARFEILRTCSERRFAVPAGAFMSDHVHLLVRGLDEESDFKSCMKLVRQRSSCAFRSTFEERLWQDGFFDHVVRDADDERRVIRYILENPVRAELSGRAAEYSYSWAPTATFAARNFSSAPEPPESPHG